MNSSKNDVAFLGEMRLGGGYLFTPQLARHPGLPGDRASPAWPWLRIRSSPTTATGPTPPSIDADGSLIVHGIQAGIECNY